MPDHMPEERPQWRNIINACESHMSPLLWRMVQSTHVDSFNGTELAVDLGSFISRVLGMRRL